MSDGDLVRQTLTGQLSAYEELVRRWSARTLAFCRAKVRSLHLAEDLAQESLLRAFRALDTLAEPDKFGPWLRGIALRVCLDWLKCKQAGQVSFGVLDQNGHGDQFADNAELTPDESAEHADDLRQLLAEVDRLPDDYREVLLLYYYDEVTYQDLAELLEVSAATINARLTKARQMLRERLHCSASKIET